MRIIRHAPGIIIALGLLVGLAGARSAMTHDEPPKRVIVRVSRNLEVKGFVEFEDHDVVVVRTLDGKLESFAKPRLLKIVRLVDPKPGQTGVVILRNGQQRQGVIIEDTFDHVLMEVEGIRAKLVREAVDQVILEPTFDERYARYKAAIKPQMPQRHLDLCRWLLDQRRYELARKELLELLESAQSPEAHRLLTIVNAQLALRNKPDQTKPTNDGDDARRSADDGNQQHLPARILSREDVNLIRVYELDFERPPKVSVDRETIRTLIETYGTDKLIPASRTERTRLYRAEPLQIVELMFKLHARELYPQIEVLTEPYSLNLFRQRVHNTWLMNNCATSRCHGGVSGGRLFLHRSHYKDPRVRYTNLLTLERLDLDPAWPLVNYESPADSLILQYGLPRALARKPHPPARGWKPAFRRPNDRMIRDAIEWIEAMMQPRPEYPVAYDPLGPGLAEDEAPPPEPDRAPR